MVFSGVQQKANKMTYQRNLYLTEKEVATRLGISVRTLQKARWQGGGVPFRKFGRSVRYHDNDVRNYETACLRVSTSDSGKHALCNMQCSGNSQTNQWDNTHIRAGETSNSPSSNSEGNS